jgi:hypothetical protein
MRIIAQKRNLFKRAQSSNKSNDWEQYTDATKKCSELIVQKETEYQKTLIEEDRNLSKVCSIVSGKKQRAKSIPLIKDLQEQIHIKGPTIAETFNQYFTSVYNPSGPECIRQIHNTNEESMYISMNDVLFALKEYNYKSAVGDHSIPNAILKNCSDYLANPLLQLFKIFTIWNVIPDLLKCNRICPIIKPNKPMDLVSSYRPNALSSNVTKILDMILNKKLNSNIYGHNLLSYTQYGFVMGKSCDTLMIDFMHMLYAAFEDKEVLCVDTIMLDLSSAFDKVLHTTLIEKMMNLGIDGPLISIMTEQLTNRKQYVHCNGYNSEVSSVTSGVIQGGITSPTQFNIYVSDLQQHLLASILFQYADDKMLLKFIKNKDDVSLLQRDLDTIYSKCEEQGLHFNASKSVHLRIQLRQRSIEKIQSVQYTLNNEKVPLVNSSRYLGVIIDTYLNFQEQCNTRIIKATQCWGKIKSTFKRVKGDILLRLYRIHVLPVLEYGLGTLTLTITEMRKMEGVQKKITKSICFSLHGEWVHGYQNRLTLLHLMSIQNRYHYKIVQIIGKHKLKQGHIPYSVEKVTFKETRLDGMVASLPFTRLHHTDQWVIHTAATEYNKLPVAIRNLETLSEFKKECKNYYLHKPTLC